VIVWILAIAGGAVALVLVSGARPGWRRALASQGGLGDALLRAAIGAAGLAGMERAFALVERSKSALYRPDPTLPGALDNGFPGLSTLSSGTTGLVVLGALAAAVALGARTAGFRKPAVRAALVAAALITLAPLNPHSLPEFVWRFGTSLALAGWLAVCAFALLKDHVAAWVFFGALVFSGGAAFRLLAQPAPADQTAGWIGVVLAAVAAAALVRSVRREPSLRRPAVPVAAEEPPPPGMR
jgi:hypothetical protein